MARLFHGLMQIVLLGTTSFVTAEEFQVSLNGGSVITVDVSMPEFAWTKVLDDGEMVQERIKFSQVKSLVLSESPASEQVAEIGRMIAMLGSPDYLQRRMAEAKLSDPEFGGNFKTMIKSHANHEEYEVRYRVARVLDNLEAEENDNVESEFDLLTLKDGSVVEGDAGNFQLECTFRDRQMTFSRSDIRLIAVPPESRKVADAGPEIQVSMFHDHVGSFYLPEQTVVDFERAPNGADIRRNTNVDDMFTPIGLKFSTEQEGYVGISGYGFKFPDKPATGNSICVFETIGSYSKRFKGVMEVTFCMPNQKSVAAGVHEFGLLMARVNHSRDFIVEAYNTDGQILASVESSDQPCVFAGVISNEPIAKIRILSNPYLFRVDRAIDEDYAVDSICFSSPVPISRSSENSKPTVRLKNGDLIQGDKIKILGNQSVSIDAAMNEPIVVNLKEVNSLHFEREATRLKKGKSWTAMLDDRSTIYVEPGKSFTSKTFPFLEYGPDELMGLWSTQNPARFPEASDFEHGKKVVVFPTCRFAMDTVEFTELGYQWDESAKKLIQPTTIDGDERDNEDPTPTISAVQFEKAWPENIPTMWMNPPKSQDPGTGRLRLADGQQFVLNDNSGFQLSGLDNNEVTISIDGEQAKISIAEVLSIEFPENWTP